jgi:hypothetical protein
VILEDVESNTPSVKAAAVPFSASVDTTDPALESSKPVDLQEAWYDVEDGRYVYEDPQPSLLEESFAPLPTEDQPRSYHGLEEPMRHPLSTLLGEDGKAERSTNVSELEKDMLLAFKEQEQSSSATAPGSPTPHHHPPKLPLPQLDQEPDQSGNDYGGLERPRNGSLLRNEDPQVEAEEAREHQRQEVAADTMREIVDDDSELERVGQGEKRRRDDGKEEPGSDTHQSEDSGCINDDANVEASRAPKRQYISPAIRSPSTTTVPKDTDLEESQLSIPVIDPNHEWEVHDIVGRKTVDSEKHYLVEWEPTPMTKSVTEHNQGWAVRKIVRRRTGNGVVQRLVYWEPTWMPESELEGARELINEFEATTSVCSASKLDWI